MAKGSKLATFNAPGLGYDLMMDGTGRVFTLDSNGKPVDCIAFRDEQGIWQLVMTFPIKSNQLVDTLEQQYRAT